MYIPISDNLCQSRHAVFQAFLAGSENGNHADSSDSEIFYYLDKAKLSVRDAMEGRSTLQGIPAEIPEGELLKLLEQYSASLNRLDRLMREGEEVDQDGSQLAIYQQKTFRELRQAASTIDTFLALRLVEEMAVRQQWQRAGVLFWLGFLSLSLVFLWRGSQAEIRQGRQEQLTRALLASSRDAVFVKDRQGKYLLCNKAMEVFTGMPEKEILGNDDEGIFSPPTAAMLRADDQAILSSGRAIMQEEILTSGSGTLRIFFTSKGPLFDREGEIFGMYGIARDITESRQMEEERTLLQQQLIQAQKMESVGRLAGGMAHDFNNMLGIILGHLEFCEEAVDKDSTIYQDLMEMKKAVNHSVSLTRQLLAFARKQEISPVLMDANTGVENTLKMLKRLVGENIRIDWKPGKQPVWIQMDPAQLDQVLVNLCINARDAMGEHGTLRLEVDTVVLDAAYCALHLGSFPGAYARLTVDDNGAGITRDVQDKIFDPFFTTKESGKGTGLGLSIVYGIVRQNRGFIQVVSKVGKGTSFAVHLPLEAEKPDSEETADQSFASGKNRDATILFVEDDPALLDLGKMLLESLSYRVVAASSAEEALQGIHGFSPDLLISDVVLPGMDGRELADLLSRQYPGMKKLFMSGYGAGHIMHGRIACGNKEFFIQKPFSRKEMAARIEDILLRS
ncbi:ATP-binding protein [Desulfobotulus sp. H1]|uniref:histidine kinase n=1 Tax=Desulfobotulus pelophilus TaxID=2823377 RepID=A0ABT3NAE7_9BACT|nr:PAS domain-containing sensor histidine kinase [Desulfobotulus pelophilus]MCW7754428.1 ATP-binding protein [Desulfobotulus pelophilus]